MWYLFDALTLLGQLLVCSHSALHTRHTHEKQTPTRFNTHQIQHQTFSVDT